MKYLAILAAAGLLSSCNTMIGLGRDTKAGYQWTRAKMQGGSTQQDSYDYGAPVY